MIKSPVEFQNWQVVPENPNFGYNSTRHYTNNQRLGRLATFRTSSRTTGQYHHNNSEYYNTWKERKILHILSPHNFWCFENSKFFFLAADILTGLNNNLARRGSQMSVKGESGNRNLQDWNLYTQTLMYM